MTVLCWCRPPLLAGDGVIDSLTRGGPQHSKQEPRGVHQPAPSQGPSVNDATIVGYRLGFSSPRVYDKIKLGLRLERNLDGLINCAAIY